MPSPSRPDLRGELRVVVVGVVEEERHALRPVAREGDVERAGARAEDRVVPDERQRCAPPGPRAPAPRAIVVCSMRCASFSTPNQLPTIEEVDHDEAREQDHGVARRVARKRDADHARDEQAREERGVAHARVRGGERDHQDAQREPQDHLGAEDPLDRLPEELLPRVRRARSERPAMSRPMPTGKHHLEVAREVVAVGVGAARGIAVVHGRAEVLAVHVRRGAGAPRSTAWTTRGVDQDPRERLRLAQRRFTSASVRKKIADVGECLQERDAARRAARPTASSTSRCAARTSTKRVHARRLRGEGRDPVRAAGA